MSRSSGGVDTAGIEQLNRENEAARFDEALVGYFRVARKRRRLHTEQEDEMSPEHCLKQLKQILRYADQSQAQYVQRIFANIVHQLKRGKKSPTVFNRAVDLCREIFKRSVAFRALIATQTASFFDQMLVATGDDPQANVSRALRVKRQRSPQLTTVLALIETWKQDFGAKYPAIVAGHAVLMERGYEFPRERERQQEARQQIADMRRHRDRVCDAKKQQRDREMAQFIPEMEQVLVEMNRIFEILVPTLDAFQLPESGAESPTTTKTIQSVAGSATGDKHNIGQDQDTNTAQHKDDNESSDEVQWQDVTATTAQAEDDDEDVEWETVSAEGSNSLQHEQEEPDTGEDQMDINDIVQAYGLGSSSYQLTVEVPKRVCEESADNDVLFHNLKDNSLRIRKRFLPLLDDWEQHSTLPSSSSPVQSSREVLPQIRDLRDRMTRALLKWQDLVQSSKDLKTVPSVVTIPLDAYNPRSKKRQL